MSVDRCRLPMSVGGLREWHQEAKHRCLKVYRESIHPLGPAAVAAAGQMPPSPRSHPPLAPLLGGAVARAAAAESERGRDKESRTDEERGRDSKGGGQVQQDADRSVSQLTHDQLEAAAGPSLGAGPARNGRQGSPALPAVAALAPVGLAPSGPAESAAARGERRLRNRIRILRDRLLSDNQLAASHNARRLFADLYTHVSLLRLLASTSCIHSGGATNPRLIPLHTRQPPKAFLPNASLLYASHLSAALNASLLQPLMPFSYSQLLMPHSWAPSMPALSLSHYDPLPLRPSPSRPLSLSYHDLLPLRPLRLGSLYDWAPSTTGLPL